jgi:hypothetical protein
VGNQKKKGRRQSDGGGDREKKIEPKSNNERYKTYEWTDEKERHCGVVRGTR